MNDVYTLNRKILVIDDSVNVLDDFQKILCPDKPCFNDVCSDFSHDAVEEVFGHGPHEPFDLSCAEDGMQGCTLVKDAKAQGAPFAVVFLDVRLASGWNGIDTAERIWDEDPDVQVVLCTAYPHFNWTQVLQRLKHPDQLIILRKPIDPIEVWQLSTALAMKWHCTRHARMRVEELEHLVWNRTCQLEDTNRQLQQDLFRRLAIQAELAHVVQHLEERNLELSAVRDQALNEIQERERIEQMLRQKTEALAQSNRDLEHFASIAAHDLQEPLHSIQVFLDLLRVKYEGVLDASGRGYIERVKKAAERMQQLIQGLLVFSKVDRQSMTQEIVVLRHVIDEILSDLGAQIDEMQAVIHIGALPTVQGDGCTMRQLFQNIIGNALKFHKPGVPPVIHISGKIIRERRHTGFCSSEELCQIEIQDEGIGIPSEQFDKIFKMFKRLHPQDEYEGTGIGLAVCKRIVDQCGGAISVRSRAGEGSTFIVTIPTRR